MSEEEEEEKIQAKFYIEWIYFMAVLFTREN